MPYQVSRSGKPIGVLTRRQIIDGVTSGLLSPSDHVWREGMSSWCSIASLGLASQGPDQPAFWDSLPRGVAPSACPRCGAGDLVSLESLYANPLVMSTGAGVVVNRSNPWDAPPPQPSTMGLGFALYLLAWPLANAACMMLGVALGEAWFALGLLLSLACLGFLIFWHRGKIAQNNLSHAKRSYVWRNTYRCPGCGMLCYSLDSDSEGEIGPDDLQPG